MPEILTKHPRIVKKILNDTQIVKDSQTLSK